MSGEGGSLASRTLRNNAPPMPCATQQFQLTPKSRQAQSVVDWSMEVKGGQREMRFEDEHAGTIDLIIVLPGAQDVRVTCTGTVEVTDTAAASSAANRLRAAVAVPAADAANPARAADARYVPEAMALDDDGATPVRGVRSGQGAEELYLPLSVAQKLPLAMRPWRPYLVAGVSRATIHPHPMDRPY